jgi:hypothetical protein
MARADSPKIRKITPSRIANGVAACCWAAIVSQLLAGGRPSGVMTRPRVPW